MKCTNCQSRISDKSIFCPNCGTTTQLLTEDLNAKKNFIYCKGTFSMSANYLGGILFAFFWAIFFAALFLQESFFWKILLLTPLLPFCLIPLCTEKPLAETNLEISDFKISAYPKLFLLSVYNSLFFLILRAITSGIDPILNLVFLIMSLYWVSIILPVPYLIFSRDLAPHKAIWMAVKQIKESRWQQFFTLLYVLVVNIIGFALFGFGLCLTVPFSYALIQRYSKLIDEKYL